MGALSAGRHVPHGFLHRARHGPPRGERAQGARSILAHAFNDAFVRAPGLTREGENLWQTIASCLSRFRTLHARKRVPNVVARFRTRN